MSDVSAAMERAVKQRADQCCEYCHLAQEDFPYSFHIEHIISRKHGGATVLENLCLSCPTCNAHKGSDIAGADTQTGLPTFLFHPRKQNWREHFQLDGAFIEPLSPE
jgi:5-methylcytosine-specific restriction endonuclease McrA